MKKTISLLLLMLFAFTAFAPVITNAGSPFQEYTSGDYKYYKMPSVYNPNEYNAIITQYRGSSATVVIPDQLNGMYVTGIDTGAFKNNKKVKSVTLPAKVGRISPSVFEGCTSLTTVKFPELSSVYEIGKRAFYGCTALKSITLPTQLLYLGDQAFYNCTSLSRIYLNAYNMQSVGENVFANAGKNCSDTVFVTGQQVSVLPQNMFNCSTSSPAYVNRAFTGLCGYILIGRNAYKNCVALKDNYVYSTGSGDDNPFGYKYTLGVPGTTVIHTYNRDNFINGYLNKFGYSYEIIPDEEAPTPTMTLTSVASSGKTRISWNFDARYSRIQIYRSETKTGGYKRLTTTYAFNEKYTDKTAEAGKVYYYKIRYVGGKFCSPKYRTCKLPRPVVTAKTTSSGKIRLTWEAIDGAVSYKVYRSTEKDGTYKLLKTTTNTSFLNLSVQKGVRYYYKVRAICSNTNGNSAYSEIVSAKVS